MLSSKELALLLHDPERFEDMRTTPSEVKLIEGLAGLVARRRVTLALIMLCFSVLPLLGGHMLWDHYQGAVSWGSWLATTVAGGSILWRDAGPGLASLMCAFRRSQPLLFHELQRLVRLMAGLLLLMHGPVVDILACLLLLPPCSGLAAQHLGRRLEKLLTE